MRKLLNRCIDYLQEKFPPNRVVLLLTPVVFVPVSAWASAWLAKHLPGVQFSPVVIAGAAAAGALSALTAAYKWIDGWQYNEARLIRAIEDQKDREAAIVGARIRHPQP